jgi:hypothetical protein
MQVDLPEVIAEVKTEFGSGARRGLRAYRRNLARVAGCGFSCCGLWFADTSGARTAGACRVCAAVYRAARRGPRLACYASDIEQRIRHSR